MQNKDEILYCIIGSVRINGKKSLAKVMASDYIISDPPLLKCVLLNLQKELVKFNNIAISLNNINFKMAEVTVYSREITQEDHDNGDYLSLDIGDTIQEEMYWGSPIEIKINEK